MGNPVTGRYTRPSEPQGGGVGMHTYLKSEADVLDELRRLQARLVECSPEMRSVYRYRIRYCRMLLAAFRDGVPERWAEYGDRLGDED